MLLASAATQAVLNLVLLGPLRLAGSAGGVGSMRSAVGQQLPLQLICIS